MKAGLAAIKRFDVTVIKTVPTVLTRILAIPGAEDVWRASRGRTIVYGGSPMSIRALREGIDKLGKVFVPTTPNPTSGFYLLVPINEVTPLNMTMEEAFKLITSSGLITPGDKNRNGK